MLSRGLVLNKGVPGLFWSSRGIRHQFHFCFLLLFCFCLCSDIFYRMLTNVLCVFFHVTPSFILSCSIQTDDLVRFRGFSPRMCAISALSFFAPAAFILALFPGACAFAYDRGVRFPGFFQLASSLLGFSHRATHINIVCRPARYWPTGDVAPQPPIFSSVSINEFFNKAFVWFVCMSVIF